MQLTHSEVSCSSAMKRPVEESAETLELRQRTHHCVTEEYVNAVGQLMQPSTNLKAYGYSPEEGRYPFEKVNALGLLLCPLRKTTVIEKWSPFEVAVFEASISLFGKSFHRIAKYVQSKSTKEVIEFYYDWKKTAHYTEWKRTYVPDDREVPGVVVDK